MTLPAILALALLNAAPQPPPEAPDNMAVETQVGLLLPQQVHDGANLHLTLAWRWLLSWLSLTVEIGVDRTSLTALTTEAPAPGGALSLRADAQLWSLPAMAGLGIVWGGGYIDVMGGWAWSYRRWTTEINGGPLLSDASSWSGAPIARSRMGWSWPLERGVLLFGGGWQRSFQAPGEGIDAMTTSGALLEVGWRARF